MSRSQVYCPFFSFAEHTVDGNNYVDMLDSLMLQLTEHDNIFIFQQQSRALPHFHRSVCKLLNAMLPNCWIRTVGAADEVASSPDLTPCDLTSFCAVM
jgi:hypothetical protein